MNSDTITFDTSNFTNLYNSFYEELCTYLTFQYGDYENARDIVQESFMKLWNDMRVKPIENAKGYVFIMAKNNYLNLLKHSEIKHSYVDAYQLSTSIIDETSLEGGDSNAKAQRLSLLINMLPPKEKEVFVMSKIENLKYAEIAEFKNISIKTVEKRMTLALKTIRKSLKK